MEINFFLDFYNFLVLYLKSGLNEEFEADKMGISEMGRNFGFFSFFSFFMGVCL